MNFDIGAQTLDIENYYWYGWIATSAINFFENIFQFLVQQFAIPLANFVLPSVTQSLLQQQVVSLPIDIGRFNYYDQFYLDSRFSGKPIYVPDSLQFYFLGEIYHRTQASCSVPYSSKNFDFIYNSTFNQTINLILTERFVNCALSAIESSYIGTSPISSRDVIDALGLNMTITVGIIQEIMPQFGINIVDPSTEIIIFMKVSQAKANFISNSQIVKLSGLLNAQFVVAENKTLLYECQIQFQVTL